METELLFGRDEGSVPTGQSLYFARTEALIEKMYHVEHKYLIYCFYICRQIWFAEAFLLWAIKRESGVTPGQSRCCEALL